MTRHVKVRYWTLFLPKPCAWTGPASARATSAATARTAMRARETIVRCPPCARPRSVLVTGAHIEIVECLVLRRHGRSSPARDLPLQEEQAVQPVLGREILVVHAFRAVDVPADDLRVAYQKIPRHVARHAER